MEFRLLGSIEVVAGEPVVIARRRERLLLAVLLLEQGRSVTTDRLLDLLWQGEPPSNAGPALRSHISRLRALLPGVTINRQDAGYQLRTDPDTVDAHRFQALVRSAAGLDPERKSAVLSEALALWRGPALADVTSDLVRARLCAGLEEMRLTALDQRVTADLDLGRDLVPELTELVTAHPTRERLAEHLMLALHRADRQADALRVFDTTRRALADELGVDPGQGLRDLHERILRADPNLLPGHARAVPRNTLPFDPPDFTGRAAEFAEVVATDPDATVIIAVDGMPGVGKTALAVRAAHELAPRYPDGQLFVDLHAHTVGRDPVPPETALASLLRAVGVPPERIPASLDDRASAWRAEVHGKRILTVLDNAADVEQIRPLIPGGPGALVLVTSRRRLGALPGARPLSLAVLPPGEAVALFKAAVPRHAESELVAEVVALCGCLPLAVRIAAARLRDRPSWTVRHLADRLRAERDRGPVDGVAAAFALSYEQLDDDHQRMFRLLGTLPGADVDAYAAAALAGVSVEVAEDLLEDLLDVHLVEQRVPGRYTLHDLLCGYARAMGEDLGPALDRLLAYYVEMTDRARAVISPQGDEPLPRDPAVGPLFADDTSAIAWCDAELPALVTAIRLATGAPVWLITRNLAGYFVRGNHLDEGVTTHLAAVAAARSQGDLDAELLATINLGVMHWRADDYGRALDCVERALPLTRAAGDVLREATCLNRIGLFQFSLGDYRAAGSVLADALRASRAASSVREEAVALWLVSGVEHVLGDPERAYRTAADALAIDRSLGDRHGVCATLIRVGVACGETNRFDEGIAHLTEAIEVAGEISDRSNEAGALIELATLRRITGALDIATETLSQAMAVLATIRQPSLLCAAHRVRGDILLDQGSPRDAMAHHQAAVDLARGIERRLELARALDGLGRGLAAVGEHHAAHKHQRAARALYVEMGIPNRGGFTEQLVV
ncbi:BTAD domain-containing putative transcriptional regulator [Actinokineospora sp. HUAS TT18]|uniref:AfsR/SARP family transcriptional regulator n=1 Tax=Actinokineospora sp. HUAS TT18 TaxID=3447451 RepID=UPI003F521C17